MRIKQISVLGLFGMFDHIIPLDHENRITIIHGPNGYGKTTILRLIDALFNNRRVYLRNTPFGQLHIEFRDSSTLTVQKLVEDDVPVLQFRLSGSGIRGRQHKEKPMDTRTFRGSLLSIIEHEIPELERVGSRRWRSLRTHRILDLDDVLHLYGDQLPFSSRMRREKAVPEWLSECLGNVSVRLIEAQRLLLIPEDARTSERRRRLEWSATVEAYSEDLAGSIKSTLAESAALSQSLDRTFPQRLVDIRKDDLLPDHDLIERMNSIEAHRSQLIDAGLLDSQIEPAFQISGDLREHEKRVLSVWVQDIERKLSIYDELAEKIELLKDIINQHFVFKVMEIDKERGFLFRTPDEGAIPPTYLSSGEQHELILTYELLFNVDDDALVLIDEPELSLHVGWQLRFLNDLQAIIKLSPFDAMVATHSPQIINDRWDLTVKLKGPNGDD